MFAFSRTWVEYDLFPMLSPPVYTDLKEKKKEGLRPSCSTHVRENANMGHPSRGLGSVANRESGGRNDSHPPEQIHRPVSCSR
jgi:hypothetical protein